MPRSVSVVPTSINLVYTGAQAAIAANVMSLPSNKNKFLKDNAAGNMEWDALPLPDVATIPQSQDGYTVTFDYASQSYILRYIKIAYNALQDGNVKYMYIPGPTTTVFASGALTRIKNSALSGNTKDLTEITLGNNALLGSGNQGLSLTNARGAVHIIARQSVPTTNNMSFTFAFQADYAGGGNRTLMRSVVNGASDTSNNINLVYYLNGGGASSTLYFTISNLSTINVTSVQIPQNSYNIVSALCYSGSTFVYLNGVLIGQSSQQIPASAVDGLMFLNGSTDSSFDNNMQADGTAYAWAACESATLLSMQKVEGWIKWSSPALNIPFTLDSSHPYYSQSPGI